MKNWSVNTQRLKKSSTQYTKWKLEQMINFGLDGKKISKKKLKIYLNGLSIDPLKKAFLKYVLWHPQS